MFCPKCGKEQIDNPNFCRSCGSNIDLNYSQKSEFIDAKSWRRKMGKNVFHSVWYYPREKRWIDFLPPAFKDV